MTSQSSIMTLLQAKGIEIALSLVFAVVAFVAGRWLIQFAVSIMRRALTARQVDATVQRYLGNIVSVLLNIALVVAILGYFGIQTTTFAALFAAAGVAIGLAWSGLLGNFAAGVFLIVLRPIKVGDFVTVGGITGTVKEIGLFVTVLNTPDNVETYVGNGKVMGDTIHNFSANEYRRVDLEAQLDYTVDPIDAIQRLKEKLTEIPNVVKSPAPDVEIIRFTLSGPVLAVRPYTHTDHYWQVYFAANQAIRSVGADAKYPAPMEQVAFHALPETKPVAPMQH